MPQPALQTLVARFGKEITSNNSLTWFNKDVSTGMAEAVPAIYVIVQGNNVTYPNAPTDRTACLRLYLLNRYGY